MPGNLDLKELEELVRRDEIDTVLTVFPDVQGRLMGKRVVGTSSSTSRARASTPARIS